MEDLRSMGYKMWDKTKVSPPENVTLLVEQLGRMHALSFVLRDQQPFDLDEFEKRLAEIFLPIIAKPGFNEVYSNCFKRMADLMRDTKYSELCRGIEKHWMKLYETAFDKERVGRFAVITHGDCWSNNMMFRYIEVSFSMIPTKVNVLTHICFQSQEFPDAVMMFDYQASHFRSPVVDLSNFLFSVTDAATREIHMEDFLETYYTNVAGMIRIFGSDPEELFSRDDFAEELRRNSFYGLVNAAVFLPSSVSNDAVDIRSNDESEVPEGEARDETVFVRLDDVTGAKMRERYIDILDYAEEHGWLKELKDLVTLFDKESDVQKEDSNDGAESSEEKGNIDEKEKSEETDSVDEIERLV